MGTGKSPKEAAATFVSKSEARLLSSDPVTVNGLSAYRLVSDIRSQQGYVRVMSYFISKDKYLYVFHGLCDPSVYPRYDDVFDGTMKRFKELSDPKKIKVQPDRISIRQAKSAGTLESALRSMGVPKDEVKQTALLNGMELSDPIKAGTLLKVVDKGR